MTLPNSLIELSLVYKVDPYVVVDLAFVYHASMFGHAVDI